MPVYRELLLQAVEQLDEALTVRLSRLGLSDADLARVLDEVGEAMAELRALHGLDDLDRDGTATGA